MLSRSHRSLERARAARRAERDARRPSGRCVGRGLRDSGVPGSLGHERSDRLRLVPERERSAAPRSLERFVLGRHVLGNHRRGPQRVSAGDREPGGRAPGQDRLQSSDRREHVPLRCDPDEHERRDVGGLLLESRAPLGQRRRAGRSIQFLYGDARLAGLSRSIFPRWASPQAPPRGAASSGRSCSEWVSPTARTCRSIGSAW